MLTESEIKEIQGRVHTARYAAPGSAGVLYAVNALIRDCEQLLDHVEELEGQLLDERQAWKEHVCEVEI